MRRRSGEIATASSIQITTLVELHNFIPVPRLSSPFCKLFDLVDLISFDVFFK